MFNLEFEQYSDLAALLHRHNNLRSTLLHILLKRSMKKTRIVTQMIPNMCPLVKRIFLYFLWKFYKWKRKNSSKVVTFFVRKRSHEGKAPPFEMHPGTVPVFKMHLWGTVPHLILMIHFFSLILDYKAEKNNRWIWNCKAMMI